MEKIENSRTNRSRNERYDSFSIDDFRDSDGMTGISLNITTSIPEKDYWLGKKFFEYFLAQNLYVRHSMDSLNSIDVCTHNIGKYKYADMDQSSHEKLMHRYPYTQTLEQLHIQGLVKHNSQHWTTGDSFEGLMIAIGSILKTEDTSAELSLKAVLQAYDAESTSAKRFLPTSIPTREAYQSHIATIPRDIAHFTLALKEYSDRTGMTLAYDIDTITLIPPLFRANLSCGNEDFFAEATTKRMAKHKVSKQACDHLKIDLK